LPILLLSLLPKNYYQAYCQRIITKLIAMDNLNISIINMAQYYELDEELENSKL
jgi:hypothetical protein